MRTLVGGILVLATLVGCDNGRVNPPKLDRPPGGGLGASCATTACRGGLDCSDAGVCVGGRSVVDGERCTVGDECTSGRCGPGAAGAVCTAASPDAGVKDASCRGDGDCGAGLRCGFDGDSLFPKCLPAGSLDVGGACTSNVACAQGLFCVEGKCAVVPLPAAGVGNGFPPFLPGALGWTGAACPAESTTGVTALWSLPRASDPAEVKQDFYRLPFPNDAARGADGKLDFSRHPKDPAPVFGFDALGRYLEKLAPEPFGNYPTVLFRFDGAIDYATLDVQGANPQLRTVDLTTGPRFGQRRGLSYQASSKGNRYLCRNWLAVRPYAADALTQGTYAVVMLKGVKDRAGAAVAPSADFSAMLAATAPAEAAQAAAWPAYAPLRTYLAQQGIPVGDVLSATVFTTGDPRALMKKLAAAATTGAPPTDSGWVKCGGATPSPCPDATGPRACGASAAVEEWHALIELPIFQKGTAPYLKPADDGSIDASGATVTAVRREKVCAALTIPVGTAPSAGWPVLVYAHGTGGSYRSHAADGAGSALADVTLPGASAPTRVAVLGFDQVGHGPRRGTRTDVSPDDIVFNFGNPASGRGTMAQGAADLHGVARYLRGLNTSAAGLPLLDTTHLAFWGHSQGATEGALFLATDRTVEGALLSGASASLADALLSKRAPIDIAGSLWFALGEASPADVDTFHPVVAMLQAWSDPVDPVHFASSIAVVAAEGATPAFGRHVFQVWGKDDHFTAQPVQATFAAAAGLWWVGPKEDEFPGATLRASANGNVTSPRPVTAAVRQYVPSLGDGHFVVFTHPTAKTDATRFLGRVVTGAVPLIPE